MHSCFNKIIFPFLYIYLIVLILASTISDNHYFKINIRNICIFIFIKLLFDLRKCTVSYIECKVRGVKKEEGIVYNFLDNIFCLNQYKSIYIILITIIIINNCLQ